MKKFVYLIMLISICTGLAYGEDTPPEIQPVSVPLIEPVNIQPVVLLEAPKPELSEEKLKELKEKEALPSIEDIQAKEENTSDAVHETQSAVTDISTGEEYSDTEIIEFVPTKNNTKLQIKPTKTNFNYEVNQINNENIGPVFNPVNTGSIYRF